MKTTQLKWTVALATIATSVTAGFTAEPKPPTLKIGSPAPKLQTGKWVQGDPVKAFEKDKAYIVEFWATWCGPCKVSIPHLNEIHNKYKDNGLVVIGQDCWEQDESLVAPFIKTMGDKMTYRVALDDKTGSEKGKMADTWMDAAGRDGIPSAFLVDKQGSIAWIGHPMELKETVIEAVLAGKYDLKKATADYETQQQNEEKLMAVAKALSRAIQQGDWTEASAKVDEAEKLLPEDQRPNLDLTRFSILIAKKDYPAAYKLAAKIGDAQKDNAELLNDLAWRIATDEKIETRDLDVAEKIASRANDVSKGQNAGILDTLARVLFMKGKKDEAIALQEKALKIAEENQKPAIQRTLESYRKGKLPAAD